MLRHWLRIFCAAVLFLILAAIIAAQFWKIHVDVPYFSIQTYQGGVGIDNLPQSLWHIDCTRQSPPWAVERLFVFFEIVKGPPMKVGINWWVFLVPWWVFLVTWGPLTAVVWYLTRRRKGPGGAFPVELTKKDE